MIPRVIAYLMPFGNRSLEDFWVLLHHGSYNEEGGMNVPFLENVEEFGCMINFVPRFVLFIRPWTVVECYGDEGSVYPNRIVTAALSSRGCLCRHLQRHRGRRFRQRDSVRLGSLWSGCRCGRGGGSLRQNARSWAEGHCQQRGGNKVRNGKATDHRLFNVTDFGKVARPDLLLSGNQAIGRSDNRD